MQTNRLAVMAALTMTAACAALRGTANKESVSMTVSTPRQTTMEVVRTQLLHHGFEVTGVGDQMIVTAPKAVPEYLREVSTAQPKGQRWFVVVESSDARFFRGTKLRVAGYLMPPGAGEVSAVVNGTRLTQNAIPITQQNARMFREVEAVADWISSEAARKKK